MSTRTRGDKFWPQYPMQMPIWIQDLRFPCWNSSSSSSPGLHFSVTFFISSFIAIESKSLVYLVTLASMKSRRSRASPKATKVLYPRNCSPKPKDLYLWTESSWIRQFLNVICLAVLWIILLRQSREVWRKDHWLLDWKRWKLATIPDGRRGVCHQRISPGFPFVNREFVSFGTW